MRRRLNGQPLRNAMKHAGLSVRQLAARTQAIDPEGRGLSKAVVGFAVSAGASGRDEVSDRAAALIAAALDVDVAYGFHEPTPEAPAVPSSRLRSEMPAPAPSQAEIQPLVDQKTLCALTGMGRDWFFDQRRKYPVGSPTPFPVHMFGIKPRYRLSEVEAWCAEVYGSSVAA